MNKKKYAAPIVAFQQSQPHDRVVDGAKAACICGSQVTNLIATNNGYIVGHRPVLVDTDTAPANFAESFGICRITDKGCLLDFVDQWIETDTQQNINACTPLLVKSKLVCKQGGVVRILDHGQQLYPVDHAEL